MPAFRLCCPTHVHPNVPVVTLDLANYVLEGMTLTGTAQGHLLWPVGAHDNDAALPDGSTQVE